MDKFDIRSAKLVGITLLILIIFTLVVANAFKYLPSETTDIPNISSTETDTIELTESTDNYSETYQTDESVSDDNRNASAEDFKTIIKEELKESNTLTELTPLENISDNTEEGIVNNPIKTFDETFKNAKDLKTKKQLVDAVNEFQNAIKAAENPEQKASCYEEISIIYAIAKRYGTALSFAQKAYTVSPNANRELLVARLYYKTGNTDKATERINNVLRRDFGQEY